MGLTLTFFKKMPLPCCLLPEFPPAPSPFPTTVGGLWRGQLEAPPTPDLGAEEEEEDAPLLLALSAEEEEEERSMPSISESAETMLSRLLMEIQKKSHAFAPSTLICVKQLPGLSSSSDLLPLGGGRQRRRGHCLPEGLAVGPQGLGLWQGNLRAGGVPVVGSLAWGGGGGRGGGGGLL